MPESADFLGHHVLFSSEKIAIYVDLDAVASLESTFVMDEIKTNYGLGV